MWYFDDLFELLAFVVVLWSWKISGARANLERRNKLTRAENPSEVIRGVYGGTRVLVKDGGYVSGLCENCAVGCACLVREDGARAKKCQEQLVLLTMW